MKSMQALFLAALLAAADAVPLAKHARDLPPDAYVPNASQMASGQGSAQFDGTYVTTPSDGLHQKREKELKHEPIHTNPNDGLIIIDDGHLDDYKTE
ncbi:uncharacterized protein NFIA_024030 [Aspergillus fischeri NRRL 181]|uniref:Uncharacterized protein n=1 Tax=Neosartorya fischeri (strain ATCC 1020 / DSM 3700 / CBS 544.65 / FGSC A1164 / JCM 1740 / NRRL 181 / WB 181) TaxID=331117 RepID=A1D5H0_NEOFI|nr:uncharacterized protein NFIA_024030 [Aspergillus fischeri NRRL 181]EAW22024.1 hypothetical protein NFIA_024030 [Aspergillus fischeri NRRL 181]